MKRTKDDLVELIPELKDRGLFIDMNPGDEAPAVDGYIVSIGRNTGAVGSVYLITQVRKVESKKHLFRYSMRVVSVPDMKKFVTIGHHRVYVLARLAIAISWYSRDKKKNNE